MATQNLSKFRFKPFDNINDLLIGCVVSQWNSRITSNLLKGAQTTLLSYDISPNRIKVWYVPGSFELIYGCAKMQKTFANLDAIIAIGSIIRGETSHFEYVCQAVSQGIKELNLKATIPVIFCVLTDDNVSQAIARSGGKHGNKGIESAISALEMAKLKIDSKK